MKGKKRTMAAALLLACFLAAGTGCATEPREGEPLPVTEEKPEPNPAEEVPTQEEASAAEEPSEETASQPEQQPLPSSETAPTAETVSAPANQPDELFSIQNSLVQAELWTQGSNTEEFRSAAITDAASLEQIRQAINSLEEQPGGSRPDTPSPGPWTGQLDLTLADGSQYSYGLWMAPDSQALVLDATIWVDASGQNRPAVRTDYTAPGTDLRQLLDQLIQQQGEPMVSMDPKTWMAEGMCYLLCDNQNRLAVWLDGNPFAGIQELEPLEAEQLGQRKDGWELRLTGEYTPLRYELYENGLKVEYYNTGATYTYRLTAAQRQQLDTACTKGWEGETVPSWLGIMSHSKLEEMTLTQGGSSRSLGTDQGTFDALRHLTVIGPAQTASQLPQEAPRLEIRFTTGVTYTIAWQDGSLWLSSSDMSSLLCYPLTEASQGWLASL